MASENQKPAEIAQTLDRGLRILEVLGDRSDGLSLTEVAAELDLHRSVAARLLATLLNRSFVSRRRDGSYVLGTAVVTLARQVSNNLLVVATPLMSEVAERLGLTAVLHVPDGRDAVAVASIEPRNAAFHVGVRPGTRHPLDVGASGLAILATRPPTAGERREIGIAREQGYVVTTSELVPNFTGVEAPVVVGGQAEASVGLIVPVSQEHDDEALGKDVVALAERIGRALR